MNDDRDMQQALQHALNCHGAGDLGQAEQIYRRILAADPTQADALHYLGVIGLQTGRFEDAVTLISQAIEQRPDYLDALSNLGNALQALGRFDEAAARYREALQLQPRNAAVIGNLGNALLQSGEPVAAIDCYEAALEIEPRLLDTRRNLAHALLGQGRATEALAQIELALNAMPDSPEILVTMGNVLSELGKGGEAIACFEKVLVQQPGLAPVQCNLANVLRQNGRLEAAIERYEQALQQAPDYAEGHYDLGLALQDIGDKDGAAARFRRALEIDAHCGKAWRAIAGLSKTSLSEDDLDVMQSAVEAPDAGPEERMHLEFALGKGYEDKRNYSTAIEHLHRGNALHRRTFDYSIEQDATAFANLQSVFDSQFFERWSGAGIENATPVFIVGMPRSGTTLCEQILASHPDVHGGGELRYLARAIAERFPMVDGVDYTAALADARAEGFKAIGQRYVAAIRELDADIRHISDKLPNNFLNVGMIRIVFPNARIVHCMRDPRDTCYSIYKNFFSARGHYYAYDMVELGRYYRLYSDLMAHWNAVLPGVMYALRYEDLVQEQEGTTRALVDACGLDWDPACMEFHKTRRPVATISASQVRQPMYSGSVGAWKNVEASLEPLLETLAVGRTD